MQPKMKNRNYRLGSIVLGLTVTVILFLTSCNDMDEPTPIEVAHVSIYHGSPDTDGLDIRVSTGQINNDPFKFRDFSNYLNFYPGNRNMKFINSNAGVVAMVDTTFTFEVGESYSVLIANKASNLEAVMIEDSFPEAISGKAMVRFIHLSPDVPAVRVLADEDDLFDAEDFKSSSDFKPVDAGRVSFEFIAEDGQNTVLQVPNVELMSRRYYNIILTGFDTPPAGNTHELSADIIRL